MTAAPDPIKVVLVDDSGALRAMCRTRLDRTDDFQVVGEAADGQQGLAVAQALQPDLVLLDIFMPLLDGFAALPKIVRACPDTQVVVFSAHGRGTGLPQQTAALGSTGYIVKGTPMATVLDELRRIMAQVRRAEPSR